MSTVQSTINDLEEKIKKLKGILELVAVYPNDFSTRDVFVTLQTLDEYEHELFKYDSYIPWLIDDFGKDVYDKLASEYRHLTRHTRRGTKEDAIECGRSIAWRKVTISGVEYLVGKSIGLDALFIEKLSL